MWRTLRRFLDSLALFPKSLRQSIGNPTQADRLPDTSGVELEFPVVSGSLPENRRSARWLILFGLLCCLPLAIVANFNFFYSMEFMLGAVGALALAVFSCVFIGFPKRWSAWLYYLCVLPPLMLAMTVLREPLLIAAVACVCAVIVADSFACHFFHLQTTSVLDRNRALQLRSLWRSRWSWSTARGLELYSLLVVGLLAFPVFLWWLMSAPASGMMWANVPPLALGLLVLLLLPLVVELLAGYFYVRPWIRLRTMRSAFWPALVQWFTYNPQDLKVAGAYQTPAGSCRRRRRLSFWVLILFAASFAQLFSHGMDFTNRLFRVQGLPRRGIWEKLHDFNPADWHKRENPTSIRGQSPDLAPAIASSLLAADPKLEPYQERMLQRMPPEEREQYLKRLRERAPVESDQPPVRERLASEVGDWPSREKQQDRMAARFFWLAVGWIVVVLTWASYPVFAVLFPLLYVGGFCFATTGRVAGYLRPNSDIDPQDILSADGWEELVKRVQSSQDNVEKKSLLLGVNASDNTPVLVPLKVFEEHAHLIGDSGSGKTSLGISLILSQMARVPDTSVVVIDLKGDDLALFSGSRIDSEKANKPFRWFTNELNRATYAFNPLRQAFFSGLSLYQKTDVITTALGLQYGTDYGRGYYSDANAELLFNALKARPDIDSFRELEQVLGDRYSMRGVSNQVLKDGSHIRTIVSRLAATEALNVTPRSQVPATVLQQQIEFGDVFRTPQVIYLHLPSSLGTTSSAEIARIALYSLLGSARTVPETERKQVFVFIDEFQRIVSGNLELILQTARSMKVGLILANQSMYDLKRAGIDLMPAVRANTRYKQIFAASNVEDQRELIALSGQTLVHQRGWSESLSGLHGGQVGASYSETLLPRLGVNDILLATDHPLQSIVQIRRGDGYAQYGGFPFVMRSTHHISAQEFGERKNAAWPEPTPATLVPTLESSGPPPGNTAPSGSARGTRKSIIDSKLPLDETESDGNKPGTLDDLWQSQVSKRKKQPPHSESERKGES